MKTQALVFIGLIVLAGLGFSSCKKCKNCTVTVITETTGIPIPPDTATADLGELCDDDLKAVDGETVTESTTNYGITVTATSTYDCKK